MSAALRQTLRVVQQEAPFMARSIRTSAQPRSHYVSVSTLVHVMPLNRGQIAAAAQAAAPHRREPIWGMCSEFGVACLVAGAIVLHSDVYTQEAVLQQLAQPGWT